MIDIPVLTDVASFKKFRESLVESFWKSTGRTPTIGCVPTMGALHRGHFSLLQQAKSSCDLIFASIFVNPKQFAPHEDFDKYPRQLEQDLQGIQNAVGGIDGVFAPAPDAMYPATPEYLTYVTINGVDDLPEGSCRKGFFRGVATVVTKLFNIVQPTHAFFGQKDGLQCIVVKQIVRDLNQNLEIVVCPIIREEDGLALSSRNVYLTPAERAVAPTLYSSLCAVRDAINAGEMSISTLQTVGRTVIAAAGAFTIDYFSLAHGSSGVEIEGALTAEHLREGVFISLAAVLGSTRLIDNIVVGGRDL